MAAPTSLWGKIKNWLGIGVGKVKLEVNPEMNKQTASVSGKITLTATSDQHIKSMKVVMQKEWSINSANGPVQKNLEMGIKTLNESFDMKAGETRSIDFSLPIQIAQSTEDQLKAQGGILGAIGSASSFVRNEQSKYYLKVFTDMEGVLVCPSDTVEMNMRQ